MADACGSPFQSMPKIELHAHLSGSISRQCLHEIWLRKTVGPNRDEAAAAALLDPLLEMSNTPNLKTFFPLFSSYIYKLVNDAESITYSTNAVLQAFEDDGVVYLELRTTPRAISAANITTEDYIQLVLACITAFNITSPSLRTNLILSIDRNNTLAQAEAIVSLALKYRSAGHPIVGIDLCGDPSRGDVSVFAPAFQLARENDLPSTIHLGEVAPPATTDELWVLLGFEPRRLGHVIHVPDEVRKVIVQRNLGVELCLSCNVLADMLPDGAKSYGDHHFADWRRWGNPIALSTDDVGVFGSALSEEYALVQKHFDLDEDEVKALARGAIECVFGGEEVKERLRELMWV